MELCNLLQVSTNMYEDEFILLGQCTIIWQDFSSVPQICIRHQSANVFPYIFVNSSCQVF